MNAFNEEFTLKAALLSVLEPAVGRGQALWLTTYYFGVGHYYGVPYGIVGLLLAGFLGWFLGKSMQETGGLRVGLVHPLPSRRHHFHLSAYVGRHRTPIHNFILTRG